MNKIIIQSLRGAISGERKLQENLLHSLQENLSEELLKNLIKKL